MSEYSRSITITVSPAEVQAMMNVTGDLLLLVKLGDIADRWHAEDALTTNAVVNRMARAVVRDMEPDYDWPVREFSCDEINER
jgi:hypothetical protein